MTWINVRLLKTSCPRLVYYSKYGTSPSVIMMLWEIHHFGLLLTGTKGAFRVPAISSRDIARCYYFTHVLNHALHLQEHLSQVSIVQCYPMKSLEVWILLKNSSQSCIPNLTWYNQTLPLESISWCELAMIVTWISKTHS